MKKILSIVCFGALLGSANAQESLISDIMQVDAVEAASGEDMVKAEEEYQAGMEKERGKLDKALEKLDNSYKKDVGGIIKNFEKVLKGAVEKEVNNEKSTVQSAVNTLTIKLRREKKTTYHQFGNAMAAIIRELPDKKMMQDKEKEVADIKKEYYDKFDQEFNSNQKSIKDFMQTQHVTEAGQ